MQISHLFIPLSILHVSLILSFFFITFCRILGKDYFWVIDDLEGIAKFSEKWDEKQQKKIDEYEVDTGKRDAEGKAIHKTVKFLSFIPELGFPGCILRFLRLHFGKEHRVIGKNSKGHDVWGYVQSPIKHHVLSMLVQAVNLVLAYFFLKPLVGENIAFASCLLYSVHPLCTQTVAWISGINYSLCMVFSLAMFNAAIYIPNLLIALPLVALFSFVATFSLYLGGLSWVILAFMGHWWAALVSGVIGMSILFIKGNETKEFRVNAFKEQNMGGTTFLNWRKPIVMIKTLWYYVRMVFVPIQMGLYHVWGYFYEEPIERVNGQFLLGLLTLGVVGAGFYCGDFSIRLGILWFLTYFIIFSNFITAQQFVADRYVTVASFGVCLVVSTLLYPTPLFWLLVGLLAMRTFTHLPTFKNELDFYHSNFLNFRKSEVSLGNLGVAYINQGMPGAAVDTWMLATRINPHYDVPWYNLYSVFKGNGRLQEARDFLKRCLDSKVVHFEKRWREEFEQIELAIKNQNTPVGQTEKFYHEAADHYKNKNTALELECLKKFMASDTTGLIPEMVAQVKQRLAELEPTILSSNPLPKP